MAISDFVQKNPEPSVGPMADRAHHGTISAAPQEVAVAAQLQGWMLAWGIRGACWSHDQLLVEPADEREQKKPTPPRGMVSGGSLISAFGIKRAIRGFDTLEALGGLRNRPSNREIIGLAFDY